MCFSIGITLFGSSLGSSLLASFIEIVHSYGFASDVLLSLRAGSHLLVCECVSDLSGCVWHEVRPGQVVAIRCCRFVRLRPSVHR